MLLAAVSALVLLPGCGGGGDDDGGVVTVNQFVNGAKTFVLGAGYMNIYVTGDGISSDNAEDEPKNETNAENVVTWVGIGHKAVGTGEKARASYELIKTLNDNGEEVVTNALLNVSFENCQNQTLRQFFNFPTEGNDDDNPVNAEGDDNEDGKTWSGTLEISINFVDKTWGDGVKTDFKFFLVH